MQCDWRDKIAVLYDGQDDIAAIEQLATKLGISLLSSTEMGLNKELQFWLSWREGRLSLLDKDSIKSSGLTVDIEHRQGEQRTWPMPKTGAFAQAIGKKTQTVVDATAGWGQDSLAMFRMGYRITSIERNPIMAELLDDAYRRLAQQDWVQRLGLELPTLLKGDALACLTELVDQPDCVYLDPMFPPKRKKSALAKKSIRVLRDLVGDDSDKEQLFAAAYKAAGKRVVVKSPDYAEPLGGKPNDSFHGKLLRYDVYLKC
ncbi:ribosomal RNA small subunit methyltransferase J [Methyloglobulus morosus KoM1]|uniref:Ribosomal RNA small subunit methyltransferase J n=1 Tax=Methyloglobulus morosus KoM1 TaxID=1116472 RepID=V5C626_9GAMM|nr:class I SAM-dependent methyltransferase [Methyloglobulus morosus]ESS73917.1 ribosomal RNA small subunit methyltransferase J [Methyloglobulus morosus KoM1]